MRSFLQSANRPVVEGLDEFEIEVARRQSQYNAVRVLRGTTHEENVLMRFALTEEQRALILSGSDVFVELMTHGSRQQPVRVSVGEPNAIRIYEEYQLRIRNADQGEVCEKAEATDKPYTGQYNRQSPQ